MNIHQSEAYHENETIDCGCPVDGDERCEKCCDHDDICYDERICLVCDKDMTERLMARSEAYSEIDR